MEEKNLDVIFSRVQNQLRKNLDSDLLSDESLFNEVVNGDGNIDFTMNIDANGNGYYETSKYGAGVNISFKTVIKEPKGAMFNVVINCSTGGGGKWMGITTGQEFSGCLETSFWSNSKIQIWIHSTVPNCTMRARLSYHY